ncbi:MAG TPA: sulfatase-like hydrolase/transferase [Cyclobacteriaceae bacterium]|nr:sulfatase-like hydrolase/transferase [Cyclobacteriaceae bacterium]
MINKLRQNIYVALASYLLLAMILYSLCRIIFYFFNTSFFPDMTFSRWATIMKGGLRFDLTAVLYSNSLLLLLMILPLKIRFQPWYKTTIKWVFVVINSLFLATNIADSIYYQFTLRRTTLSVLSQFENEQNGFALFFQFMLDYWYALLTWIVVVIALWFGQKKIKWDGPQVANNITFYVAGVLAMPIIIYLFIGGARGGFAHSTRPITLSNAAEYATIPKDVNLVLNTPFALMRTARANVIQKSTYFADEASLSAVFNPVIEPDTIPFNNNNVVVIILESFSKEFVGAYNKTLPIQNYQGYTPFLDSLISVGSYFQYSLANGRKSIDAMPSVICSIPSIEVPYVLSHFSGNKVNSLASLLKDKGYQTAFFHGAPNGSMGFQAFANLCGFDKYYGKDEYESEPEGGTDDDYDGIWGIWDRQFFQYFDKKLSTFKQPFYATIFSVSSHHPYNLPEDAKAKFKGGDRDIYRTIEYTDDALKQFFAYASRQSWFENTLFVITADHASAEIKYPEYNTTWGYFSIPVFFYHPKWEPRASNEIIQQVDIMPTILGALNYDKPYVAFGRDVFSDKTPFAFNYIDNLYQLFRGSYVLRFDGQRSVELYDFKKDIYLKENLVNTLPDTVQSMETVLKAYIQQYNNRMVDDNLTMEGPQSGVQRARRESQP